MEAYDALSEPMRKFLEPLTAVHDLLHTATYYRDQYGGGDREMLKMVLDIPPMEHPLVRTHPVTGRKGLFANPTFTSHIVGLSQEESRAILVLLYKHYSRPDFTVRRHWRKGDLCFWDNRCTMHYAVRDHGDTLRTINRVTLLGDVPR